MKYILLLLCLSTQAFAENYVFRDPFTLHLPIDDKRYYEQHFEKIPYVHKNTVLLFVNEIFGINLKLSQNNTFEVIYEENIDKADVSLKFSQKKMGDTLNMMLEIKNNTKKRLVMNGLMTVPGIKGVKQTNILPIAPGLMSFETWPHPIVQLALIEIRLE